MIFNATFNNISVVSLQLVLLVVETTDLSHVTDKFYHIMLYQVFKLTTLVGIGTDCTGSCKSNYHHINYNQLIVQINYKGTCQHVFAGKCAAS
jgi:hypothetical protein